MAGQDVGVARARRSDAGEFRYSERDLELLRVVGEQYAVTLPQLARMMDCTPHAARWLRSRWERAGWARGRAVLVGEPVQYLASRNPDRRQVLLIVDEFSAIADGERMARMVEVVRSYGAAVVLAPQAFEGMGGPEAAARILNAAHTVMLHAVPDPDPIIKAAGTRMATEWSLQHERGISTQIGSTRTQHQMRVDPNEVRRLRPGMCFLIGGGKAQKLQIAAAPRADAPPDPVNIFDPPVVPVHDEPEGPVRL